ncbi:uncharacterized protein DUF4233 [Homoserinimonas aerilata]|uniref:Uncharacterized protein DUF4233 n=1 Tax=Homoserinimonas aerilata TaxID=1162970 RepID=A0A542YI58_9MICO|nr:DUF4233 domain-containing protein [Homoserinimonas aerilata]TQL47776.1 uncharacterized protein DUF4233 [Homoserinimonas aerilata]
MTAQPARAPRRERSATESLLSIVLGLEAVLMIFVMLTVFGLDLAHPALAFGGGAALMVALILAGRFVRHDWGVWVGWALQLVLVLLGLVHPALYVAGGIFVAIWIYCYITGRRLDRRKAAFLAGGPTTA